MQLPRWMQRAVQDQVLTLQEAQAWHQFVMSSPQEEVVLPPELFPAAERVWLWERPTANKLSI